MTNMFNPRVRPWMAYLGFMGFMGFMGLWQQPFYMFFVFFGFFSWHWEAKLNKLKWDERLQANFCKAQTKAYSTGLAVPYTAAIFSGIIHISNYHRLSILYISIGLSFAIGISLVPYLTYRYDLQE